MKRVSAGGSHALQQWQTVINTHKRSDTKYTLWLASILPHFQSIHALCNRAVTFQLRNAIVCSKSQTELDRKWIGIDRTRPRVCAWSCWWRIQVGWWKYGVVVAFLPTPAVFPSKSSLKTWNLPCYAGLSALMPVSEKFQFYYILADGKQQEPVSTIPTFLKNIWYNLWWNKTKINYFKLTCFLTVNSMETVTLRKLTAHCFNFWATKFTFIFPLLIHFL